MDLANQTKALHCVPAFSVAHWEQLQQEKQELECRFEAELQGLRAQQQRELGALEERLRAQHMSEAESLQVQQQDELEELQLKQQEQVCEFRRRWDMSKSSLFLFGKEKVKTRCYFIFVFLFY